MRRPQYEGGGFQNLHAPPTTLVTGGFVIPTMLIIYNKAFAVFATLSTLSLNFQEFVFWSKLLCGAGIQSIPTSYIYG